MEKYTIIYQDRAVVKYSRIETDDLEHILSMEFSNGRPAWFVFVGWPKLEGEK